MRAVLCFSAWITLILGMDADLVRGGDEVVGRWEGVEAKDGEELPMVLDIRREGGSLKGTFSFPRNGILDAPLQSISATGDAVSAKYGPTERPATISAKLSGDKLLGEIVSGRLRLEMRLERVKPLERPYTVESLAVASGEVRLAGQLYRPRKPGRHPAVVIVPGSGDVAHVGHPFMADFLARRGCVCLLYSKRGVGESTGNWRDVGFWELADDANAAARALSELNDVDPARVGLLGHSQAGWILPMAASRNPQLAYLVVISGGPVTVEREGYWDVEYLLRHNGFDDADVEEALSYYQLNNHVTRTGKDYDKLVEKLNSIRARPWFRLLGVFVAAPPEHSSRQWYRRVMDLEHEPIVASLRVPVLWIYGDNDADFPSLDAARIVERIRDEHKKDFTVKIFPGASHAISVPAPKDSKLPFGRPAEDYPDLIERWLRDHRVLE